VKRNPNPLPFTPYDANVEHKNNDKHV